MLHAIREVIDRLEAEPDGKAVTPALRELISGLALLPRAQAPTNLREVQRAVSKMVDLLHRMYGADALPKAQRVAELLPERPFAQIVLRRLERRERAKASQLATTPNAGSRS